MHLHLSLEIDPSNNKFVKRSNFQLFFFINHVNVYFISINPHLSGAEYSDLEFMEIINRNWPDLLSPYQLKGIISMEVEVTQEDRHLLRNMHINSPVKLSNGLFYIGPGLGVSSGQNSVGSVRKANDLL